MDRLGPTNLLIAETLWLVTEVNLLTGPHIMIKLIELINDNKAMAGWSENHGPTNTKPAPR